MPILKPVISLAVAGAIALSAYAHLDEGQRGKIASVEQAVMDTVGSGIGWVSGAIAGWVPYRMPEVQPNGDIVIKHLSPGEPPAEKAAPGDGRPVGAGATNT